MLRDAIDWRDPMEYILARFLSGYTVRGVRNRKYVYALGCDASDRSNGRTARIVEWTVEYYGRSLHASRRFHPCHNGRVLRSVTYSQAIAIGPRGGVQVYHNTFY